MLPEVLGVEIPSRLQNCHQSSAAFIAEYNCNSAEKKKKGRKLQLVEGQMDFDNNQVEVVDIDWHDRVFLSLIESGF